MNHPSDNQPTGHAIRLRGPGNLALTRNGTQQEAVRVRIPGKFELNLFEARKIQPEDTFVLLRTFGKPTGLDETQTVTLELSGFDGAVRLMVNRDSEESLAVDFEHDSLSVDITNLLNDSNRFEVQFDSLPAVAGDVKLWITE